MHVRIMVPLIFFLSGFLLWAQPQTAPKKEYEVKIIKNQEVQFIDKTTRAVVKTFNVNERKPFRTDLSKKELLNRYNFSPELQYFISREDINIEQGASTWIKLWENKLVIVNYSYDAFYVDHVLIQLSYMICFNRSGEIVFEGELKPFAADFDFDKDLMFFAYRTTGSPFYGPGDDVDDKVYIYSLKKGSYIFSYKEKKITNSIDGGVFFRAKFFNNSKVYMFHESNPDFIYKSDSDGVSTFFVDVENLVLYSYSYGWDNGIAYENGSYYLFNGEKRLKKLTMSDFNIRYLK